MRMDIPQAISRAGLHLQASTSAPGLGPQLMRAEENTVPDLTGLQEAPKRVMAVCAQIGNQIGSNTFNEHLCAPRAGMWCATLCAHLPERWCLGCGAQ